MGVLAPMEGDNYLVLDGHVKAIKPERVLEGGWDNADGGLWCGSTSASPDTLHRSASDEFTFCTDIIS
ncbi:MAG: hypothetical protein ABI210_14725 [Abditibacteriaceae bacterium]